MYLYEQANWPNFTYDMRKIMSPLNDAIKNTAALSRDLSLLDQKIVLEHQIDAISTELVSSFAIEGEDLDQRAVGLSVRRALNVRSAQLIQPSRSAEGIAKMMLDVKQNCSEPLTHERLFRWHKLILPDEEKNSFNGIKTGCYRTAPMQVISGMAGRPKIHFVAVPPEDVYSQMERFLKWFNDDNPSDFPIIRAAIAHLWFVTIHPFDDGNGRMARAVCEMLLFKDNPGKSYSLSYEILKSKRGYYKILETAQKGTLDITDYLLWFIDCQDRAVETAYLQIKHAREKALFWLEHQDLKLNERQKNMLNALLDDLPSITSGKWAVLCRCSADTALNDIKKLVALGVLEVSPARGRSTKYILKKEALEN